MPATDSITDRNDPHEQNRARDDPDGAARRGLYAVVLLAGVFLVYNARGLWFGGDEWFIITDRGLTSGPGHLGLFEPHYEHWSTLPILAFRGLYSVFGLHSYWPYIAMVIIVHLAIVVLLWHVMVGSQVDGWVATCACAVFAAAGTGFENLTNAWQVQLISPIALGLGAILVTPESGARFTRRDAIAAALLSAAVMCSGVALPMLVAVALIAFVRRGWRVTVLTVAVPAALYGWWYLAYGRSEPFVAKPAPRAVPKFVWNGLTDALGDIARIQVVGTLVVVATLVWLAVRLVRGRDTSHLIVPVALAIGGITFLAATGYRRGNLGVVFGREVFSVDPATSRYAYVTIAFVLPVVALASQSLFRGSNGRRMLLAAITIVLVVAQARKLDYWTDLARPGKRSDRGAVLATAALARGSRKFLLSRPLNVFEPQVSVGEIVQMDHDGKLPPLDEATAADRLTVLARLDLVVGPDPVVPTRAVAHIESARRISTTTDTEGCVVARARPGNELVLRLDGPGTFRVRGEGPLVLRLRDGRNVEGETVGSLLPGDHDQVVSAGTANDLLVLSLPTDHPTVLCEVVQ
ncbi:MAG: hypothetical protein WD271_16635 [Acidimicrobiia bacterium]